MVQCRLGTFCEGWGFLYIRQVNNVCRTGVYLSWLTANECRVYLVVNGGCRWRELTDDDGDTYFGNQQLKIASYDDPRSVPCQLFVTCVQHTYPSSLSKLFARFVHLGCERNCIRTLITRTLFLSSFSVARILPD